MIVAQDRSGRFKTAGLSRATTDPTNQLWSRELGVYFDFSNNSMLIWLVKILFGDFRPLFSNNFLCTKRSTMRWNAEEILRKSPFFKAHSSIVVRRSILEKNLTIVVLRAPKLLKKCDAVIPKCTKDS